MPTGTFPRARVRTSPHAPPVKGTFAPSALIGDPRSLACGPLLSRGAGPGLSALPQLDARRLRSADGQFFENPTRMATRHPPPQERGLCCCGASVPGRKANASSRGEKTLPTWWAGSRGTKEGHAFPSIALHGARLPASGVQWHGHRGVSLPAFLPQRWLSLACAASWSRCASHCIIRRWTSSSISPPVALGCAFRYSCTSLNIVALVLTRRPVPSSSLASLFL